MHALLIDIGNTSLKIGVAGIEGLVASYTLPTDTQQSGDGLGLQPVSYTHLTLPTN